MISRPHKVPQKNKPWKWMKVGNLQFSSENDRLGVHVPPSVFFFSGGRSKFDEDNLHFDTFCGNMLLQMESCMHYLLLYSKWSPLAPGWKTLVDELGPT